jgi:hypothetical protein
MNKRTLIRLFAATVASPTVLRMLAWAVQARPKNWAGNIEYSNTARPTYRSRTPDIVTMRWWVGGGHNELSAAAYLARAGRSTLVLGRRHMAGACCVTEESPAAAACPPFLILRACCDLK